jgi:hypothetical protein
MSKATQQMIQLLRECRQATKVHRAILARQDTELYEDVVLGLEITVDKLRLAIASLEEREKR